MYCIKDFFETHFKIHETAHVSLLVVAGGAWEWFLNPLFLHI